MNRQQSGNLRATIARRLAELVMVAAATMALGPLTSADLPEHLTFQRAPEPAEVRMRPGTAGAAGWGTTYDVGDSYPSPRGEQHLQRVAGVVSVKLKDATSASATLKKLTAKSGALAGCSVKGQYPHGIAVLSLPVRAASAGVNATGAVAKAISAAKKAPEIEGANPVFADAVSGMLAIPSDELIVSFKSGSAASSLSAGLQMRPVTGAVDQFVVTLPGASADEVLAEVRRLAADPAVKWAEPNFLRQCVPQTNDTLFSQQWHLNNTGQSGGKTDADVDAPEAWAITTGSRVATPVIAILDCGVETAHPDLAGSLWTNPGETAGNGVDEDGNGYRDDVHGWDFFDSDNNPNPVTEYDDHGTAVAGVAAATGNNNLGVAGAAYTAKIMPLRVTGSDAYGNLFFFPDQMASAIYYAAGRTAGGGSWAGADILSLSLGFGYVEAVEDAFAWAAESGRGGKGCPIFCSSGNDASAQVWWGIPTSSLPAGTYYLVLMYCKDSSGTGGDDRVWVGSVQLPNSARSFYAFDSPSVPSGWTPYRNNSFVIAENPARSVGYARYLLASPTTPDATQSGIITQSFTLVPGNPAVISVWVSTERGTDAFDGSVFPLPAGDPGDWFCVGLVNAQSGKGYLWYVDAGIPGYSRRGIGAIEPLLGYPASSPSVTAVGASTDCDYRAEYSQYGNGLAFVAPSNGGFGSVTTTDRTGSLGYNTSSGTAGDYTSDFGGTSSAAPLAAGVAALALSVRPDATVSELVDIMRGTCDPIGGVQYAYGWNYYYGAGRLNAGAAVTAAASPRLTEQPSSVSCCEGAGTFFRVTASGIGPFTYQWYKDHRVLAGETGSQVTIDAVSQSSAGSYSCVVTNSFGATMSNVATLTVAAPPTIATHPLSQAMHVYQTCTFTVAASGTGPFIYTWWKGATMLQTGNSPSYTIDFLYPSDAGSYTCTVTNQCASVTSNAAVLTVDAHPVVESITPETPGPTNANKLDFLVKFSDWVSDFDDVTDVIVYTTDTAAYQSIQLGARDLTNRLYYVTVNGISGDGKISISVKANAVFSNDWEEWNLASGESDAVTIDNTAPELLAPPPVTVATNTNVCYATGVNLGTPSAADASGLAGSPANNAPSQFPKGLTVVVWQVTDKAGNTATATQNVTVEDRQKPTITKPADVTKPTDSGRPGAKVTLPSPAASDNCAVASVTGVRADALALTDEFPIGATKITWTAADAAGNTAETTQYVTVTDTEAPVLRITQPTTEATCSTKNSTINIGGTATDNNRVSQIQWANNRGGHGNCTGTTDWSAAGISLSYGYNVITVTAVDPSGNQSAATLTVTCDRENPSVTITTPTTATGYLAKSTTLQIGGTATDNRDVKCVDWTNDRGGSGACAGTTNWTASVSLVEGQNLITVTATDDAGNTGSDALSVLLDVTPPTVTITEPTTLPVFTVEANGLAMRGTATDNIALSKIEWKTDHNAGGVCIGTLAWTATGVPLVLGDNTITITATDTAGNTSTDSIVVTYVDRTPPTVQITWPSTADVFARNASDLALKGTASDDLAVASVCWYLPNRYSRICEGTTTWTGTGIPLNEGSNIVTVRATDTSGNFTDKTIVVQYIYAQPESSWTRSAMVALPIIPDNTDPKPIVGFDGTGWFAFSTTSGAYYQYPSPVTMLSPVEKTPGRGFWAFFAASGAARPAGTIPDQTKPVSIRLATGWNLVGQPFINPVKWDQSAIKVQLVNESGQLDPVQRPLGESRSILTNYAWGWDPSKAEYYLVFDPAVVPNSVAELSPWRAYWIRAYRPCDLILPAP